MKSIVKVMSMILALVMLFTLAACGKTEETTAAPEGAEVETEAAPATEEELTTVHVYRPFFLTQDDASTKAVEEAINAEIAQYGVQITLTDIAFSDYSSKLNLELAAGGDVDVFFTASWMDSVSTDNLVKNKAVLDITELIEQYPTLKDSIPENFWASSAYNGSKFFVPINKDLASGYVVLTSPETAEALELNTEDIKQLSDLTPYLEKAKTLGYKYPFLNQNQGVFSLFNIDKYSRLIEGIAAIPTDGSNKVVAYPTTEEFKEYCTMMYDWAEAGYINEEEATKSVPENAFTTSDCAFTWMTESVPSTYVDTLGWAPVTMTLTDSWIVTGASLGGCYGISANTQNPEAAMKVLEHLLADTTVADLYTYGIEGVNYDLVDGKVAIREDSVYRTLPLLNTSMAIVTPTATAADDFVASVEAMNNAAKNAPCLGFTFNMDDCSAEFAAVQSVYAEYGYMLETGFMDPDEFLPKYLDALDEAGLQVVIDSLQTQLDTWLAAQK